MASTIVCQRGALFTCLTLLTIGISSALFIAVVYYFVDLSFHKAEKSVFAILVVAMVVSLLLLIYGFYASICGGKAAKFSLAVIYLIYALVLLAIGVALLAIKDTIIDAVEDYFLSDTTAEDVRSKFETEFKCEWEGNATNCKTKIQDLYKSFGVGIAAGLIVLFAILLLGDIIAWRWLCSKWEDGPAGGQGGDVKTPLTYSW
jgi:hypothetical protein